MARINPPLPVFTRPVFRVRVIGELFEQTTQNTFYLGCTSMPESIPDATTFGAAWSASRLTAYFGCLNEAWIGKKLIVDRFDFVLDAPIELVIPNTPGALVGDCLPSVVSMRLRRTTTLAGQRGYGMIRLPAANWGGEQNEVEPIQKAAIDAFRTVLGTDVETANPTDGAYAEVLATRTVGPAPLYTTVVNAEYIDKWIIEETLGTSRSRLPRPTV